MDSLLNAQPQVPTPRMVETIEGSNIRFLLWQRLDAIKTKLELGDVVLLLYAAAFVRQYLWIVSNNSIAWVLTALVSLLIWSVHLRTKERIEERVPWQFWLVVALPLFVIYAARVAFPEVSFDVLDYHLINAERALRGFPFIPGDFFPTRFPFNPAPDMVLGIGRHILGFRLGTIINYLAVLWAGALLNRWLRPYITNAWLRSGGLLLLLLTENLLFIINNYMVDLLALPLLLEATCLALAGRQDKNQTHISVRLALLLGASVAFKLTNLAFAAPILITYAFNTLRAETRTGLLKNSLLLIVGFVAPLLPFTLYIYWQTGNPIFPLYNKIFMSPFWPATDFVGVRWGPVADDLRFTHMKWWEVLLWPVLLPFKLEHTATYLGRYFGRLSLGVVAAFFGLLPRTNGRRLRNLSFIVILASILWSAISGMLRYGLYLELSGGVVILCLISHRYFATKDSNPRRALKQCTQVIITLLLVAQSAIACMYVYQFEWGSRLWITNGASSSAAAENIRAYANDSRFFLRDYSLMHFLPQAEKDLLVPVQAWVESTALESGVEVQLKNDIPALCVYMPEYFSTPKSRERFAESLYQLKGKKMFTLCHAEFFKLSVEHIQTAGLGVGRITPLVIPYYSQHTRLNMALIEVLPPDEKQNAANFSITEISTPLDAFRAEISWAQPPSILRAGLKETVYVRVRNASNFAWPALGRDDGMFRVLLGNHWLDQNNKIAVNDDGRTPLLYDLDPGTEMELPLTINAPRIPGNYVLEIDMLQEGVSWFGLKGSKTLRLEVIVEK